jgi:hypothetical protein
MLASCCACICCLVGIVGLFVFALLHLSYPHPVRHPPNLLPCAEVCERLAWRIPSPLESGGPTRAHLHHAAQVPKGTHSIGAILGKHPPKGLAKMGGAASSRSGRGAAGSRGRDAYRSSSATRDHQHAIMQGSKA